MTWLKGEYIAGDIERETRADIKTVKASPAVDSIQDNIWDYLFSRSRVFAFNVGRPLVLINWKGLR